MGERVRANFGECKTRNYHVTSIGRGMNEAGDLSGK